ncbi:oxygen-independent coproporphyrinogen III oxidase [bacterium]|nr:oxygen-independent coproporphyrinogen III oxidase [bacterium]
MGLSTLIEKYSTAGPRYTSYPTAPQWKDSVGGEAYRAALGRVRPGEPLALYVHLPFCEKLCYYCGCNIQITGDKSRSRAYVEAVVQELRLVREALGECSPLSQMSWGGGTPTFLSCEEMRTLFKAVDGNFGFDSKAEISLEVDPRVTTVEQLETLRELGFNRASLGVQDFEAQVQQAVNRVQPAEQTRRLLDECRRLGFEGVNFDLIYGLPLQTFESFARTVDAVAEMRPDRIALYNYARLPSLLKHQTILEKYSMPSASERVGIFTHAYDQLRAAGYVAIGMDHFALEGDALAKSLREGKLYRNFMGYTVKQGKHLLGVGASAIGEVGGGFFQNLKKASEYETAVGQGQFAVHRGLMLSDDDLQRKWIIQNLLCHFGFEADAFEREFGEKFSERFSREWDSLEAFEGDRLIERQGGAIRVTEQGRLFIRNIAMVFDAYLTRGNTVFSKTV